MPKILIIDDNEEIQSANSSYLGGKGFDVTCANTGIKALSVLDNNQFDCIVLDVLLPDLDGYAICKAARTITNAPIIFLSCLEEADDKIKGLMAGGDDYMTKPYSLKELTARIRALIRRSEQSVKAPKEYQAREISIDADNRILHISGKNILLSEREFNLFMLLYENPGKSFSKEELLIKIWNKNAEIGGVATLVSRLRHKIKFAEDIIGQIESGYGNGYKFTAPSGGG